MFIVIFIFIVLLPQIFLSKYVWSVIYELIRFIYKKRVNTMDKRNNKIQFSVFILQFVNIFQLLPRNFITNTLYSRTGTNLSNKYT